MKFSVALIVIFAVITYTRSNEPSAEDQWKEFKIEFKRNYTEEEDKTRFLLFKDTLEQINEHNRKYEMGKAEVPATLNEYSDWTDEDKRKLLGMPLEDL